MPSLRVNGEALRAIRERTGLNIPQFAEAVGIGPSHVSLIERNQRNVSPAVLTRMADALGVPKAALLRLGADGEKVNDSNVKALAS